MRARIRVRSRMRVRLNVHMGVCVSIRVRMRTRIRQCALSAITTYVRPHVFANNIVVATTYTVE